MLTYRLMRALATHPFGDIQNAAVYVFLIHTTNRLRTPSALKAQSATY